MQHDVTVRNALLDAIETAIGASPKLRFHTGAMPANCAAARTGTQLLDATLPADFMAAASGGSKALTGTWQGTAGASGYATYYSIMDNGGTNCREQGLLSQAWAASTAYALTQQVSLGGRVYKCVTAGTSAGSGGPTGTGTGITDGTAVWDYVGVVDIVLDNTNVANGQTVTITSKTLTAPGA